MIVSWMTTNQCNLNCKHCYQNAGEQCEDELTTIEAFCLIEEIAKAGFKIMIFSGGEPLMRPDILELAACAKTAGLRPVFGTNGTLISKTTALRLKESGVAAMGISVDSLDAKKHDLFRGITGAFEQTMEGIRQCKNAGLPFQIHTTVMDWNEKEIELITDFAVQCGAAAHYIFFLIPVGRGKAISQGSVDKIENEKLIQRIMEKQKSVPIELKPTCAPQFTRIAQQMGINTRFTRGCLAGLSYCVISPSGVVRPCAYMEEVAGNIREEGFQDIWKNSRVFNTLRTQQYAGSCGQCDFKASCGGCRARAAYYHQGDYMEQDDYCAYGSKLL